MEKSPYDILFELLHSGDEAIDFLCENNNSDALETCISISESIKELYENIAEFIKNNNIREKHRGSDAALNATFAAEKLNAFYRNNDFDSAAFLLSYELIPLHIFLTNELNFWFAIYPDTEKMHEHRDSILENIKSYMPEHEETLEQEYEYDVSVMVLCYNKVHFTKIALESLLKYTNFDLYNVEIIVVNNGSDDNGETSAFIRKLDDPRVKSVDLAHPLGYNGYSLGPLAARGRYFVEFHSDVVATENWLDNLMRCISSDPKIGAVAAVCNDSPNFQSIEVDYSDPIKNDSEMQRFAKRHNNSDPNKWEQMVRLMPTGGYITPTILYRLILRDPWFYYGQFADDDMSAFLRRGGFKLVLAKDTFLHHFGSQTSSVDIRENDSINHSRKRFYTKWCVDAWKSSVKNRSVVFHIQSAGINSLESFLFIDPLFGSTPMWIQDKFKRENKNIGKTVAIVSDERYEEDARNFFDITLSGGIIEMLNKVEGEFDYILFDADISEYIDKNFPDILKALRCSCKPKTKVLFTLNNPSYYKRIHELASGLYPDNYCEPWLGIRFVDPLYVHKTAIEQGFDGNFAHISEAISKQDAEIVNRIQAIAQDEYTAKAMTYAVRLFELSLQQI